MYQVQPTQITTKQGECEITLKLEINLNINTDGGISVASVGKPVAVPTKVEETEEDDKVDFVIPDFNNERIQFGKEVKE